MGELYAGGGFRRESLHATGNVAGPVHHFVIVEEGTVFWHILGRVLRIQLK